MRLPLWDSLLGSSRDGRELVTYLIRDSLGFRQLSFFRWPVASEVQAAALYPCCNVMKILFRLYDTDGNKRVTESLWESQFAWLVNTSRSNVC